MNPSTSSGTTRNTRKADYHIVEQAGRFKVYDGAGRFRLTFGTREAAQAYIDGKHSIDGHVAFQVAAAVLVVLFLLCYPATAHAYPKNCRRIPHGQICTNSVTGNPTGRCDVGYQQMSDLSCEPLPARPWAPWGMP